MAPIEEPPARPVPGSNGTVAKKKAKKRKQAVDLSAAAVRPPCPPDPAPSRHAGPCVLPLSAGGVDNSV